ncbi:MAG: allantoinase [Bacteriovoracaceae bacterium]|jgi:allantoinase
MKILTSSRVITPGSLGRQYIAIEDSKILKISSTPIEGELIDKGDLVIMAGLVDTHVHVNEPGRTDWEGFETATKACAAGGITTVVDMPLNCLPVTTTKEALEIKLKEVKGKLYVDTGFWGGVVPDSVDRLEELLNSGVLGVKSFLIHSGIDEFPEMKEADLEKAMPILSKHKVPYLIHAEVDDGLGNTKITDKYESFEKSRPNSWEDNAISLMIKLCKKHFTKTHIVHLASGSALNMIEEAKKEGLPFTVETCPHYLTFKSEEIPDGKTLYKCCPPIRGGENRELLWDGIKKGLIDFIVSDHSPCTANLKMMAEGDFEKAWGGIASLQFSLPIVWTEAVKRGFSLNQLSQLMSERTAEFIGLGAKKGSLIEGADADFVIWDPDEEFTLKKENIQFKNKVTPYEGKNLMGVIYETWLRGEVIFSEDQFSTPPQGQAILRT